MGDLDSFSDNCDADSGESQCPYAENTTGPCDVDSLVISEATSGKSISCKKQLRMDMPPENAPDHLRDLFAEYDLVMEAVAEYKTSDPTPPKKIVDLSIESAPIGSCPDDKHVLISLSPMAPNADTYQEWFNSSASGVKIEGMSTDADKAVGVGKWLSPFWFFGDDYIKEFKILTEGCGVRDSGTPVKSLNGLLRVYRKDDYELSLQIPPFKKTTRSRKGSVDAKGNKVTSTSESAEKLGQKQSDSSSSTTVNIKEGTAHTTDTAGGKDGAGYTTVSESQGLKEGDDYYAESEKYQEGKGSVSAKDSTDEGSELLFELERQNVIKPTITFKRNGSSVDFAKAINDIINVQHTLLQAWNDIKNWVPKIGWSADVELSVMVGTVSGSWGCRVGGPEGPRFVSVERYLDLTFKVDVVTYKASLMFGVDFSIPSLLGWFNDDKLLEIILKAEGSISGGASVSDTIKTSAQEGFTKNEVEVKGTSKVDVFVQGRVMAMGYGYDAKGGITGGIIFSGKLISDFDNAPVVNGELYFEETKIYARFIDAVEGETSEEYEQIVFQKKELWKGQLPDMPQEA